MTDLIFNFENQMKKFESLIQEWRMDRLVTHI
jgi:hypothetical protein